MRKPDLVEMPVSVEAAVQALRASSKVRIQLLCEPMDRRQSRWRRTDVLSVCVVDVETTGLDPRADRVIEFAGQRIDVDIDGHIVGIGRPRGWLEDPGIPIPPHITEKTGITDEIVKGQSIGEGEAYAMLTDSDVILSHNASFDRPFVEKRFDIAGQAWICSMRDLDWKARGFPKVGLEDLLWRCGWFFHQAHRATADVNALLHLLDHTFDTGETVLKTLWANAAKSSWLVEAEGAAYEKRFLLKGRGYAWNGDRKVWWRHVGGEALAAEKAWLACDVYGSGMASGPVAKEVTWKERYGLAAT